MARGATTRSDPPPSAACPPARRSPARAREDGIWRYVHTATGNYNPETAKVYTDLELFTVDEEIVSDVSNIFDYRASQAGISIDLIVRGICSLPPGIPSRIFWFLNGGREEMYVGSADLMERNLDRRVETLVPVRDPEILERLRDMVLNASLQDTDRAMVLDAGGRYTRPAAASGSFNAQQLQQFLLQHYQERADRA